MSRGLLAVGAVGVLISGCGGGSGRSQVSPSDAAKTRFAIAQYVEARVASLDGDTNNGDELATVCSTQTSTTWYCTSSYVPANGIVTSVNQDVADTTATYESNGDVDLTAANSVAGQGLNGVLPAATLRRFIAADGSNVGAESQGSGSIHLTPAELAKQSMSTLASLQSLLAATQPGGPSQAGQPSTDTTATDTSAANPSTTDTTTTDTGTTSPSTTDTGPLATSSPKFGPPCGTVTGGTYDYQGQKLTVYAGPGVECNIAMQVFTDLSGGNAENHPGSDQASSYVTVDGWTCPYGNMGTQSCTKDTRLMRPYLPGSGP